MIISNLKEIMNEEFFPSDPKHLGGSVCLSITVSSTGDSCFGHAQICTGFGKNIFWGDFRSFAA